MNIHPVELITQQVVEQPLESLNLHLHRLYESQLLMLSFLQGCEQKLLHYSQVSQEGQQNNQLLIKTYNDRIYHLKLKLLKLSKMLDLCNVRVDTILDELVD